MSSKIALPSTTSWSLAARLTAAPTTNAWAVLAVARHRLDTEAEDTADQLASLIDTPVECIQVKSAHELLEAVEHHSESALVLVGLDGLGSDEWRKVDANRSRLERKLPTVVALDEASVPTMLEYAPNLWSWLSASAWSSESERGLSEEQRAQRLSALREHYGFDDAELVRQAEAGALAPEPDLAEWLVLIGKGYLIGR